MTTRIVEEPDMILEHGTVRTFETECYMKLREALKPFYIAEKYNGDQVFRVFGTNVTLTSKDNQILISGDETAIREAKGGIEKLVIIKLRQVVEAK